MRIGELSIPARLVEYALANNLAKELRFIVCLKFISCGYLSKGVMFTTEFKDLAGFKTDKSIRKYMTRLIKLGWAGQEVDRGVIYPRSWAYITRITNTQSKRRFPVTPKDIKNYKAFFIGVVTDLRLRSTRHYQTRITKTIRVKRGGRLTGNYAHQKDCANQKFPVNPPLYFGLSNQTIGKMANRSQSWGSSIKKQAVASGYLLATHQYLDLGPDDPSQLLRSKLAKAYPDVANRFKLSRVGSKVCIRMQLHDEITSRMVSSRRQNIQ